MADPSPGAAPQGPSAASYHAQQTLRDGRPYVIRALRPADRDGLRAAIERTSPASLYRRFFSVKRYFSDREADYFLNIDFVQHVALVAEVEESGEPAIVAGARYVLLEPGRAEMAFAVIDEYQGQGLGSALMRSLAQLARAQGLRELVAEVLPENAAMLSVFEKSGLTCTTRRERDVVHVSLAIAG
jgi:RimJ/RimL family protein N-acetyltransferase